MTANLNLPIIVGMMLKHIDDERLIQAGASLTPRDAMLQSTPLRWACRWGRSEPVQLFLEHGADIEE